MPSSESSPPSALALSVRLRVEAWEAWAPGLPDREAWRRWAGLEASVLPPRPSAAPETPAAAQVPALLRRRAGAGGRLALEVAGRLAGRDPLPGVFASRHGQILRSVGMLEALARGESLSPMDFSVSVHNAAAGLFSMARGDRSAFTALAAGRESFSVALLEAQGMLLEGAQRVLAVYHDEAPPSALDGRWDGEPAGWALSILLGRDGGQALDMELWDAPGRPTGEDARPQALTLARLLAKGEGEARWSQGRHTWIWGLPS